jgi:hypothetical protein
MAGLSMRSRLLCAAGAILLLSPVRAAHPASAQGLNDVIRNLDNTIIPDDAQRREDRRDGRAREGTVPAPDIRLPRI